MNDYNWNDFNPQEAADAIAGLLPAGEYRVLTKSPRWVDTKDGAGKIFFLSFEVIDGELRGQTTDIGFNLINQNDTAVRIARGQLGKICLAMGLLTNPRSEAEFTNKTLMLTVSEREYNGRKLNQFEGARPVGGQAASPKPPAAETKSAPPKTNGGKLPWQK